MYDIAQIITMKCNGKCPYCMYGTKLNQSEDIPLADLIKFYDGITEPMQVKITGGEPLHVDEVSRTVAFVRYLFEKHDIIYVQVNTNGYYDIPKEFLDNPKIQIQVSLDGPADYQDKIFGEAVFAKIDANLSILAKSKCSTHIMAVITDANYTYVEWLVEYARRAGIALRMQYVSPVDLATTQSMVQREQRVATINRRHQNMCRPVSFYCGHFIPSEDTFFAVDAQGSIVNCPIMSQVKSGLSIYNCNAGESTKIKKAIQRTLGTCTCSFPAGVVPMIQSMSPAQLRAFSARVSEHDKEGMRLAYGITL